MAYLAPIHRPSSVRHAIKLNLLSPDSECLVLAYAPRPLHLQPTNKLDQESQPARNMGSFTRRRSRNAAKQSHLRTRLYARQNPATRRETRSSVCRHTTIPVFRLSME